MPLYNPGILATGGSVTGNLAVTGNEAVSGTATWSGTAAAAANLVVGGTTALGDNGVGEIQLANATTVPTTNPVGGPVIYATGGGLFARDPGGVVSPLLSTPATESYPTPGAIAETCHRYNIAGSSTPATGTLYVMAAYLEAGQSVGHIGFGSGSTATTAAAHWWLALLDNTFTLRAHTADQLTANVAASTWYSIATVATYTATYTGCYYLGVMVATSSGNQPSILSPSFSPVTQLVTGANIPTPVLAGTSSTGLTVPGTDGTTAYLAPTGVGPLFYMYAAA
jgi:hypothetical protein